MSGSWKKQLENEGGEVEWNEAGMQIRRINFWEEIAGRTYLNLLQIDAATGLFGFELCLNSLNNLFFEISGELSDKELEEVYKYKSMLDEANFKKVFIKKKYSEGLQSSSESFTLDNELFHSFKMILEKYRLLIARLKKKHGFGNPAKDSAAFAMFR